MNCHQSIIIIQQLYYTICDLRTMNDIITIKFNTAQNKKEHKMMERELKTLISEIFPHNKNIKEYKVCYELWYYDIKNGNTEYPPDMLLGLISKFLDYDLNKTLLRKQSEQDIKRISESTPYIDLMVTTARNLNNDIKNETYNDRYTLFDILLKMLRILVA